MKKYRIIMLVLVMIITFSGCSTSQSLSDLSIVEAVGIDYTDKKTDVSLQYLNLAKGGSTTDAINSNITSVVNGKANNISSAISNASSSLSKEIFFGQNKVIIFGKEYVEYGVDKGLDYLLRSVDSRPDVLVAMADESAVDIIKSEERGARIPSESIYNLLETGEKNGFGAAVSVNDLLNMYSDKTSDIYLPVVKLEDKFCSVGGIAIFSKEKYKATLDKNESLGFLILQNKIKNGFVNVNDNELGAVSVELISSKAKNEIVKNDDSYVFTSKIKIKLTLNEVEKGTTTAIDEEKIKEVEGLVNKKIELICKNAYNSCVSNESDALMLGRYLSRAYPESYKKLEDNWRNKLKNIRFEVKVSSDLEKVNDTALRG